VLGPFVIRRLRKVCPERIASDSQALNELHSEKQGTPSMGGLLVIGCWLLSLGICARFAGTVVPCCLIVAFGLMALGLRDDWVKSHSREKGVTPRQKLVVQALLGSLVGAMLFQLHRNSGPGHWLVEVVGNAWFPGGIVFVIWSAFFVTLLSNAVNLTDGLDGLASGTSIMTLVPLTLSCIVTSADLNTADGMLAEATGAEAAVAAMALLGAVIGFLWFNGHPASVFLGDTGALPLGGILAVIALSAGRERILIIAGGVFIIEAASVVLQVAVFKLKARRILRCSPLHNHFVFRGDPETKIVLRFWLVSGILAMCATVLVLRNA